MSSLALPSHRTVARASLGLAAALLVLAGCTTAPQSPRAAETTKYTLESSDRFALVERATEYAISCTGLMEHPLADGRTEVVANLKNREPQRLTVQASCVFRDAAGAPLEETPWQTVTLAENMTVAVRFNASSTAAKHYTVRVRDSH